MDDSVHLSLQIGSHNFRPQFLFVACNHYLCAMEQQANQRIEFIDLTKGLCIMLVVMMHVGGVFDSLATGPILSSFTMPLYFFV